MKVVKILGSGCKKCSQTAELIEQQAKELGIEIKLEKVTDMSDILSYGVMSTPGVVIDEKVVHTGGLPAKGSISEWLL